MRAWVGLLVAVVLGAGGAVAVYGAPPPRNRAELMATALSPDGKRLLAAYRRGDDGLPSVRLWDVATGRQMLAFAGHERVSDFVAFLPDGKRALSKGWDDDIVIWDLEAGKEASRWRPELKKCSKVALSPDGQWLLVCGVRMGEKPRHELARYETDTGRALDARDVSDIAIQTFLLSPSGKWAAFSGNTVGLEGGIKIWDIERGAVVRSFQEARWFELTQQSLKTLADAGVPERVLSKLEPLKDKTFATRLRFQTELAKVLNENQLDQFELVVMNQARKVKGVRFGTMAWSPDNRSFLMEKEEFDSRRGVWGRRYLLAWDEVQGKETRRFERRWEHRNSGVENGEYARLLRFSPNGQWLIAADGDWTIRCWEWATGKEVWAVEGAPFDMAFTAEGREVLLLFGAPPTEGSRLVISYLDAATGKTLRESKPEVSPPPPPDGRR